jgi:predicted aspartyl protease
LVVILSQGAAWADDPGIRVAMQEKSAVTFYVPGKIPGYGAVEFMVDTGSGYMTINEQTLEVLEREGNVRYIKQLRGILADGSELEVPVYSIERISIGGNCWLEDVEAAVFPGTSRQILGLSALRKAAPFVFSVDPPALTLSRCGTLPETDADRPALTAAVAEAAS